MTGWRRNRKRFALVVLSSAVFILAAISFVFFQKKEVKRGAFKNFNVLLITLDTTRRDHLPVYGYRDVKTPNLDRLAAKSYVFEDAISHAPLTLPSHTSILTGMLPPVHGVRDNTGFFVDQKLLTLPEILKSKGYATSAFVSAFVLDSRWQLNQGFDLYHDFFSLEEFGQLTPQHAQRRAEETGSEATQWLNDLKEDTPFFSWIHFYDPHDPYEPPDPYRTEYSARPYDGEIAYMDSSLGKLLDAVSSSRRKEETIIIVTADHGEGLGEHQEDTHAVFVYDTTQRVPLLIHVPGKRGHRVPGLARHIDLAPTILDLLGIETDSQMQGNSLIPLMNGWNNTNRSAYMESVYADLHFGWAPVRSLVTSRFKYIAAPKPELYDRIQDPNETRNLIDQNTSQANALKNQLRDEIAKYPDAYASVPEKMDSDTEERLRALGYIGSARHAAVRRNIDPKDRVHLARSLQIATAHVQNQRNDDAIQLLLTILQEDPGITDAHFLAGVSFIGLKQYDQAINQFNKTLETRPNDVMSLYNLGYAFEQQNEQQKALKYFLQVVEHEPLHLYANSKIGQIYYRAGQTENAAPYFLNAANGYLRFLKNAKKETVRSALHARVGEAYFGAGNLGEAKTHFLSAIELSPQQPDLHYNLGSIYEAEARPDAATQAYLREIELNPENYKALNNLGFIYKREGKLPEAVVCFQRIIDLLPDDPRGYLMLASLYREMGREQEATKLLRILENQRRRVSSEG